MKIDITPKEFADLVVIFLYDNMVNADEMIFSYEEFNEIMEFLKKKGMKSHLMQYYLRLDAHQRLNYKRIRDAFTNEDGKSYTIKIYHDDINESQLNEETNNGLQDEKTNKYYVKEVVKKVLKEIRKRKLKPSRKPITEEKLDGIIEKIIENEGW